MRIALVPSSYAPAVGGVEIVTRRLASELRTRGHDVEIWTPRIVGQAADDELDGLRVVRVAMPLPSARPAAVGSFLVRGPLGFLALAEAYRRFRPDVVNIHCFGPNGPYAAAMSLLSRTPLVVSLHGETVMDDHDIFERSSTLRRALGFALARAEGVTACSAFVSRDALRFGTPRSSPEVIFNAVDPFFNAVDPFEALDDSASPSERYFLGVGRVVAKKGFDTLLRAFAEIRAANHEVGLVIAGDGSDLGRLRELAASLEVEDAVRFVGRLDRSGVERTMRAALAVVVPSFVEPFGVVALEAWAAARPLLITSAGGPPEFVKDGVDGILIPPGNPSALATAMQRLLADPERANRIARAGAARAPSFNWPATAASYESVYRSAVAARAAR